MAEDTKTEITEGEVLPHPSSGSLRGLDLFTFFVADVQTGFGPFISVYLTGQKWTQTDIGIVLAAGAGNRFSGRKQLAELGGRPLLEWALRVMAEPARRSAASIWSRHPGLPAATMLAPVAITAVALRSPSAAAVSGCVRL